MLFFPLSSFIPIHRFLNESDPISAKINDRPENEILIDFKNLLFIL